MDELTIAEVEVGEAIRSFRNSDTGKYLKGVCDQDVEEAKEKLLELDPYAYSSLVDLQRSIAHIQRKALIANELQRYMEGAIQTSEAALNALTETEE